MGENSMSSKSDQYRLVSPKNMIEPKWHSNKSEDIWNTVYVDDTYKFRDVVWNRPPKHIIDVGANVGWFSKLASETKPDSKIFAYELVKENYLIAVENLKDCKNVDLFNSVVVGDNSATSYLHAGENIGGHKALYEGNDSYISEKRFSEENLSKNIAEGDTLETDLPDQISFKDIINQNNIDYIDFLKIDCEGCEHEILKHIFKHDLDRKILNMSLEIHGTTQPEWEPLRRELESRFDLVKKGTSGAILICKNKL
tara:strand:+ start:323 stop:1087 length:765 start_codon:yes stop_codon:yes gene_type:complete